METDHFGTKGTIGQMLERLRRQRGLTSLAVGNALGISGGTYRKIERDERELSFIMGLQLCRLYEMDIFDMINLIDEHELDRTDISIMRMRAKRPPKKGKKGSGC